MSKSYRFLHTVRTAGIKVAKGATGRYLLFTNTVACGGLLAAGDVTSQLIEWWRGSSLACAWDKERTGRFLAYGLLAGPINHYWYEMLDKYLAGVNLRNVVRKIALDQIIFAPTIICGFFIGLAYLEGKRLSQGVQEAKSNFIPVYKMDLTVWPAAQMVNFYFVPPQLRVIYVSTVTFGWSTFLAYYKTNLQKTVEQNTSPVFQDSIQSLKAEGMKYLKNKDRDMLEEERQILKRTRNIVEKMKL